MKKIKTLEIHGRRWFQKSYGNTYHSVKVYVNDEILYCDFAYGYDGQYIQTALDLLKEAGYEVPSWYELNRNADIIRRVDDVPRKKDLKFYR